jgi:hypothetical protein
MKTADNKKAVSGEAVCQQRGWLKNDFACGSIIRGEASVPSQALHFASGLWKNNTANAIGLIEITTALLIASRPFSPKASFLGSLGAIITVLLTISFLFSTPGALQLGHGISTLGDTGQFLIKDLCPIGRLMLDSRGGPSCRRGKNQPANLSFRRPVDTRKDFGIGSS